MTFYYLRKKKREIESWEYLKFGQNQKFYGTDFWMVEEFGEDRNKGEDQSML